MKLHFGSVESSDHRKRSEIITNSKMPEIIGVCVGVVTTMVTTIIGRRLYRKGGEDLMNSENKALENIGVYDAPDKVYAKVLE